MGILRYYNRISEKILSRLIVFRDFKVSAPIVVFESDDWGSVRVSSKEAWNALTAQGYQMNSRPYERFDILESDDDIKSLSDVLMRYSDKEGHRPIFTLNYLSANPNFEKIRETSFKDYYYETIDQTYNHTLGSENVINFVKEGISNGVFCTQCHGREHFNVMKWIKALANNDADVLAAFEYRMCGIFPKDNPMAGNQYMVALKSTNKIEQEYICNTIKESLRLFESIWGQKSLSFIAPCYTWNSNIEEVLHNNGVKIIQGERLQRCSDREKRIPHYMGQRNRYGQIYTIRNCFFEPATSNRENEEDACFYEVKRALDKGVPAVISSHRINYVGGINERNRERNLEMLDRLIRKILEKYPDVKFLSSDRLVDVF